MTIQSIVALLCPGCGDDLSGLDTDTVFGCGQCGAAYEPGAEGLEGPFPLRQVEGKDGQGSTIALPFWQLTLAPLLLPEEVEAPERAYVPGCDLRRRHYFGDPGLRWTRDRLQVPTGPPRAPLLGMTLALGDAMELARYYVLSAVDRQQDVTGFDLDIQLSEPTVVLVDFRDEGQHLVDPIGGERYAAHAFCDLPAIRRG